MQEVGNSKRKFVKAIKRKSIFADYLSYGLNILISVDAWVHCGWLCSRPSLVAKQNRRWKYVCKYKETQLELLAIWMLFLFREGRTVPTVIQGGGRVVFLRCFASLDTRNLVQMHEIDRKSVV